MLGLFTRSSVRLWWLAPVLVVIAVIAAVAGVAAVAKPAPPQRHLTFALRVAGGTMSPSSLLASMGDALSISVETDRRELIGLHGYDKHFLAGPGQPARLSFAADLAGSFVLEIEASNVAVGTLHVQPRGGLLGLGGPPDRSATSLLTLGGVTEIGATPSYDLDLRLSPLQPVCQMLGSGPMTMPPGVTMANMATVGVPPDWRHVTVDVIDRLSGGTVRNLRPAISIADPATGRVQDVVVSAMRRLADGAASVHYGSNVELPSGRYVVTVRVGAESDRLAVAL